jgi:Tfp pilus assembly protein PilX
MNKKLRIKNNAGVATLPTILALTILILAVGIAITSLGLTESIISAGQRQSSEALLIAEAGARDALMKVSRNKNFIDSYQVVFADNGCVLNDSCATITVSAGVGSGADPKIINSEGRIKNSVRKVKITVIFDSSLNGEIQSANWEEVAD